MKVRLSEDCFKTLYCFKWKSDKKDEGVGSPPPPSFSFRLDNLDSLLLIILLTSFLFTLGLIMWAWTLEGDISSRSSIPATSEFNNLPLLVDKYSSEEEEEYADLTSPPPKDFVDSSSILEEENDFSSSSSGPIFFIYPHQHGNGDRGGEERNKSYEFQLALELSSLSHTESENFSGFVGFSPSPPAAGEPPDPHPDWVQITAGSVVCVEAEVSGNVKIGTKTIIHPCAKIQAKGGPIIIGDFNIIEELATIVNWSTEPMVIGNNNVFEVGCTVLAKCVGDHNVFETRCFVGENVQVPNGCTFGTGISVGKKRSRKEDDQTTTSSEEQEEETPFVLQDNSVFYGAPMKHRVAQEKPAPQSLQIDFLAKILPNYHHVKLTTLPASSAKKEPQLD